MAQFNVGEWCLYQGTGSELQSIAAGARRPAVVLQVDTGVSPEQYTMGVYSVPGVDGFSTPAYVIMNQLEYSASPTNGKLSVGTPAQPGDGTVALGLANTLSNVKTQQGSSTGITAGAAATVLLSDGDRPVAAGKGVQADATLSLTTTNLLASATVTAKIQKSTDGGSNWTDSVTKVFTLTGAALNVIPATRDPAFSATCDRATAGNVRTRLTVSCTGANITVNESGLTTRWGVTPN